MTKAVSVHIRPGKAEGRVTAPPSKSMAHRLLIAAGLSEGAGSVDNLSASEDILATADCLMAMGRKLSLEGDICRFAEGSLFSAACADTGNPDSLDPLILPVRESGSTLRFFVPIALLLGRPVRFTGAKSLFRRPLSVYEEIARKEGFLFRQDEESLLVCGRLRPKTYRIPGNISSQFVSGLLFALPFLPGDSRIELIPPVESRPYIGMTREALASFGIRTDWVNDTTLAVPGGQKARARDIRVEGDYSNAAFLSVLNLFGGKVEVLGLDPDSLQGDKIYREYFKRLSEGFCELDIRDCPDLGPVLFSAAAALRGGRFTGTARLKIKESDRAEAMEEELSRFGIRCAREDNSFTVFPGELKAPDQPLKGHHDHRIVMALSSLLTITGGEIQGAEAVRKSWPDYFKVINQLGIEVDSACSG